MTEVSGEAFEHFIHDHAPLLSALPQWRLVAVALRHIPGLPACGPALDRVVAALRQPRPAAECEALRAYFATRRYIDAGDWRRVSVPEIDAFRDAREHFHGPVVEMLFHRWKAEGDAVLRDRDAAGFLAAIQEGRGALVTDLLSHSYDRFGTRAGVS